MEDVYRQSMAKAMGKYLKSNVYNFILVDDWCPTVADMETYRQYAVESKAEVRSMAHSLASAQRR